MTIVSRKAPPVRYNGSVRAIVIGCGIGAVLAIGNVYMGLKTGWWDGGVVAAAVLGFVLMAPLARLGKAAYSRQENVLTQTAASSAAAMPSAIGLLGALPALAIMGHRY